MSDEREKALQGWAKDLPSLYRDGQPAAFRAGYDAREPELDILRAELAKYQGMYRSAEEHNDRLTAEAERLRGLAESHKAEAVTAMGREIKAVTALTEALQSLAAAQERVQSLDTCYKTENARALLAERETAERDARIAELSLGGYNLGKQIDQLERQLELACQSALAAQTRAETAERELGRLNTFTPEDPNPYLEAALEAYQERVAAQQSEWGPDALEVDACDYRAGYNEACRRWTPLWDFSEETREQAERELAERSAEKDKLWVLHTACQYEWYRRQDGWRRSSEACLAKAETDIAEARGKTAQLTAWLQQIREAAFSDNDSATDAANFHICERIRALFLPDWLKTEFALIDSVRLVNATWNGAAGLDAYRAMKRIRALLAPPTTAARCDECDPSFGCFDGSAACSKAPPTTEGE